MYIYQLTFKSHALSVGGKLLATRGAAWEASVRRGHRMHVPPSPKMNQEQNTGKLNSQAVTSLWWCIYGREKMMGRKERKKLIRNRRVDSKVTGREWTPNRVGSKGYWRERRQKAQEKSTQRIGREKLLCSDCELLTLLCLSCPYCFWRIRSE